MTAQALLACLASGLAVVTGCAAFDKTQATPAEAASTNQGRSREAGSQRINWGEQKAENAKVRFYVAGNDPGEGTRQIERKGATLYVAANPIASQADVQGAWALHGARESVVQVQLSWIAASRIDEALRAHGAPVIAIYVDDELLATSALSARLPSGDLLIRDRLSRRQAEEIASRIRNDPSEAAPGWFERLFKPSPT